MTKVKVGLFGFEPISQLTLQMIDKRWPRDQRPWWLQNSYQQTVKPLQPQTTSE